MPEVAELQTERLLLRAWRASDRDPYAALNADPRVAEYLAGTLTREQSDLHVDWINYGFEQRGWGLWATERRDSGEFIGFIGLAVPTFDAQFMPAVEIGWRLAAEQWGQGFAPEGAREVIRFAFEDLDLAELVSFTAVQNRKSRRVMEKLGFTHFPEEDFDHPNLSAGHELRRHVLYRLRRDVLDRAL